MYILKLLGISLFLQSGNFGFAQNKNENTFAVERFGANADGHALNTAAIQAAINTVSQQGGGTSVFSKGIFLTGSFELKSNVTLDLASEIKPVWKRTEAFWGKQCVWKMLHNFGANRSVFGCSENGAAQPTQALNNTSLQQINGIEITSYGK